MRKALRTLTRPLTSPEREQIERARRRVQLAEKNLEAARHELAIALQSAFDARGNVSEIAQAAGIARQTVYDLLRRYDTRR